MFIGNEGKECRAKWERSALSIVSRHASIVNDAGVTPDNKGVPDQVQPPAHTHKGDRAPGGSLPLVTDAGDAAEFRLQRHGCVVNLPLPKPQGRCAAGSQAALRVLVRSEEGGGGGH